MPAKKKKSRTPTKPSDSDQSGDQSGVSGDYSSVSSPFFPSDEQLLSITDGASARFPCLISRAAFVGKVAEIKVSGFDGCKVWLSESAMVSHYIPYGSLVSVSLLSLDKSLSSFPLSSSSDECAAHYGLQSAGIVADGAGKFFTMANVYPSCKDLGTGVCLSADLYHRIGCPQLGRIVFVQPVRVHTSLDKVNDLFPCSGSHILLEDCKELSLFPICFLSKIKVERTRASQSNSFTVATCVPVVDSSTSLLMTTSHMTSTASSPSSGVSKPAGSRSQSRDSASICMISLENILSDDSSRELQERCALMWLMSQRLLLGNFVTIQLLPGLCLFQVVDAKRFPSNSGTLNGMHQDENISDPKLENNKVTALVVNRDTKVHLLHPSYPVTGCSSRLSFEPLEFRCEEEIKTAHTSRKLGGLSKEFAVLRGIIASSAAQVTTKRFGLRPTKGVLLHGPPGTGKTTLARICAHDAGINLFTIKGPEIISQYQGESEHALHEVFKKAENSLPALVFIDEIDVVAPSRTDGGDELSQRMVATLLNLMDGVSRTDGILVFATTNRPDSIEPALRRPGRLDREIEIGVPSPGQRHEILVSILSEMEHSLSDKNIQDIAMGTHGFVGADLNALCNEAALVCLRKYVESTASCYRLNCKFPTVGFDSAHDELGSANDFSPEVDLDALEEFGDSSESDVVEASVSCTLIGQNSSVTKNEVDLDWRDSQNYDLKISYEDFEKARVRIRPSAMREVILEVPKVSWGDVGGQTEVKAQLMEAVQWPQKHKDALERIGTRPPTGILLFGPPGCSKTLLARAVASEAGLNFLAVKGPELFSQWVGESEKAIRSLFAKARANSPSIVFFDEIDGLAVTRGEENDGVSVGDRVISQLLVEMDGLQQRGSVIVIAATNRPDNIDPALLRPGRFDRLLYVGLPNQKDREDIFRIHLRRMPCSSDVSISDLSRLTECFTGADISLICREAVIQAMEENLLASEIKMDHLKAGIDQVEPTDAEMYENLPSMFLRFVPSTPFVDVPASESCSSKSTHLSFWTRLQSMGLSLLHFSGLISQPRSD